jgi:ribosomal protein L9
MKIVQVTYTTSQEYAPQNMANIRAVMNELQSKGDDGINYHVCLREDLKTFIHTAFFKSAADQTTLFGLTSFQQFQQQLNDSGLEVAAKPESLSLVGSSKELFS